MLSNINPTPFYKSYYPNTFILYVEGDIDQAFFNSLDRKKYECKRLILGFFKSHKAKIVDYISNSSDPYEHGLVDKDFDEPISIDRLFYTDTHDLETLLLSNDQNVLFNIFEKTSTKTELEKLDNDYNKAKFIAYQIGIIKKVIRNIAKNGNNFYIPYNIPLDFTKFTTKKNEIVLEYFCQFVRENGGQIYENNLLNNTNINLFFTDDKNLGHVFNRDIYSICDISQTTDFWEIVNGHDICELLCFINNDVYKVFYIRHPKDNYRIRKFENKIVKVFERKYFKSTELYFKMAIAKLFES